MSDPPTPLFEQFRRDLLGDGAQQEAEHKGPPNRRRSTRGVSKAVDHEDLAPLTRTLLAEARRQLTVKDAAGTRQIAMGEAVVRATFTAAVKGNVYAQRLALDHLKRAEMQEAAEITRAHDLWSRYQERTRAAMARKDAPPVDPLPHPDDIVLEPGQPVRFIGPIDEAGRNRIDGLIGLRDALILQYALDIRPFMANGFRNELTDASTALVLAFMLESGLPPRLRLPHDLLLLRMSRYEAMDARRLLRTVRQSWAALGLNVRRGECTAPLAKLKHYLDAARVFYREVEDGRIDPAVIRAGKVPQWAIRQFEDALSADRDRSADESG